MEHLLNQQGSRLNKLIGSYCLLYSWYIHDMEFDFPEEYVMLNLAYA